MIIIIFYSFLLTLIIIILVNGDAEYFLLFSSSFKISKRDRIVNKILLKKNY